MNSPVNIFWFRRDLRIVDNAGLYHALRGDHPVVPIFIFDRNILDRLEDKSDKRVQFIYNSIVDIQEKLIALGSSLEVYYDFPENVFSQLLEKYKIDSVYTNHDYEPYASERDENVNNTLKKSGVSFQSFKDQVIFEKNEVLKDDQDPYTVFTPYSRRWKSMLNDFYLKSYPTKKYFKNFHKQHPLALRQLESMGFKTMSDEKFPTKKIDVHFFKEYQRQRDFPAVPGTSRLGIHLRFGTISIRELASKALELSETFLNELIWRDFYHMILWHFPKVGKGKSFKPAYDHIKWRNNEIEFEKWCNGMTGYPIVDAGMRQLNATGFMHNRVRMIAASFLVKHLLIDWRWGEAYFAEKLLDFDLAANNGGWQWSASCGCDAVPYFRIFNPSLQTKKFDPDLKYIRQWIPELDEFSYPKPIVEHEFARKRALEAYSKAVKK
ncbi:MAG: deoxyribodipyrimidine photo-lyase [Bacteroidetes bacterium]|nr:deoxyribodipyrimidine photo-lyase [Bacteroidota bacterium]